MDRFLFNIIAAGILLMCMCGGRPAPSSAASPPEPDMRKTPAVVTGGAQTDRMRVAFINPGTSDPNDPTGGFWLSVSAVMKESARQLNIDLEIIYSERDHIRMQQQAREVAGRPVLPDYLIVVNEKLAADEMVKSADRAGLKVFVMSNGFSGEQAIQMGRPRDKYKNWIGSLIPDNRFGGYQIARGIIDRAAKTGAARVDRIRLLAISGDPATMASTQRVEGLKQALSEHPDVELQQVFMGEWRQDRAREQTKIALTRYPKTDAIWAANDPMAIGAMEGAIEAKRQPGKDIFIGGLNWDPPALERVKNGSLSVSVGGHFMIGGWVLALLYDHHHGRDFADEGVEFQCPLFGPLDSKNIDAFLGKFGDRNWSKIDFTRLSKVHNTHAHKYNFSVKDLIGL
ncbi:MAG: ABC transporter substrate-binding protein [Deltaproteobacteria bacterium]|nr:ABC transporter substrate-binding protein [Deltaproteobacteria bacterium]